jgi:hypothetical protein
MSCVVDKEVQATPTAVQKMPRTVGKVSRGKVQSPLLRKALTDHLVGPDTPTGKKYSVRESAKRYTSVNSTVVGARAKLITNALSMAGSLPVRDLIAAQHVSTPGDIQNYFTPDEEKQKAARKSKKKNWQQQLSQKLQAVNRAAAQALVVRHDSPPPQPTPGY